MRFFTSVLLLLSLLTVSCARRGRLKYQARAVPDVQTLNYFAYYNNNVRILVSICKASNACLKICDHFKDRRCAKMSLNEVLVGWERNIKGYRSWEEFERDLKFIATDWDVADFLEKKDENSRILTALFQRGNELANCPISEHLILCELRHPEFAMHLARPYGAGKESGEDSSSTGITVVSEVSSSQTEVVSSSQTKIDVSVLTTVRNIVKQKKSVAKDSILEPPISCMEMENKNIVDARFTFFKHKVFLGFVKRCFGYNEGRKSFIEVALDLENNSALKMADKAIEFACGSKETCIRLAYCAIGSDKLWEWKEKHNNNNNVMKLRKCEYDDFEAISSLLD